MGVLVSGSMSVWRCGCKWWERNDTVAHAPALCQLISLLPSTSDTTSRDPADRHGQALNTTAHNIATCNESLSWGVALLFVVCPDLCSCFLPFTIMCSWELYISVCIIWCKITTCIVAIVSCVCTNNLLIILPFQLPFAIMSLTDNTATAYYRHCYAGGYLDGARSQVASIMWKFLVYGFDADHPGQSPCTRIAVHMMASLLVAWVLITTLV